MGNKKRGYILLHRKIWDNEIWKKEEPFDVRSAWIDLLLMVNHEDRSIIINMKRVVVNRGQKWTSVRVLADRWRWSKDRVMRYIKLLENCDMIRLEKTKSGTLLTVINYDNFQLPRDTDKDTNKDTCEDTYKDTDKDETIHYRNNYRNNVRNKEAPPRDSWGEVVE